MKKIVYAQKSGCHIIDSHLQTSYGRNKRNSKAEKKEILRQKFIANLVFTHKNININLRSVFPMQSPLFDRLQRCKLTHGICLLQRHFFPFSNKSTPPNTHLHHHVAMQTDGFQLRFDSDSDFSICFIAILILLLLRHFEAKVDDILSMYEK